MSLDSQLTIMEYNKASEDWYQFEDVFKVAIEKGEKERALEVYQELKQAIYIRLSPFYQEEELTRIFASIMGGIIHFACKDGGVPSAHLSLSIMQQKEIMQSALLEKSFHLDDAMKIWISSSCELVKSFSTYSYSPTVRRCVQLINNRLCDDICVEGLAKECHVSRQHLSKIFHEETNKTIIEYVQEERIRLAVKMMSADNLTITQIAYSCGFKDLNYFTRIFKRLMHQTPKRYQMVKRMLQKENLIK